MNKNFQIYRSSAGSGKTYTLSLSFIALALKGRRYGYEDYYRKILAITFTALIINAFKFFGENTILFVLTILLIFLILWMVYEGINKVLEIRRTT